jgi:hypothetical protein
MFKKSLEIDKIQFILIESETTFHSNRSHVPITLHFNMSMQFLVKSRVNVTIIHFKLLSFLVSAVIGIDI